MYLERRFFAGTKLYRMSSSPQGNYGMTTKIEKTDVTENTEKIDPAPQLAMKIILSAGWK